MSGLSIVIPSRLEKAQSGTLFLETAVGAIRAQSVAARTQFQILVGVDAGAAIPAGLAGRLDVRFVESSGASQASALNAAARQAEHDHIAFLEDDDLWNPAFAEAALRLLKDFDFVSSTQLEVDPSGEVLRINDFPTPSGWVMRRAVWERVGPFSEEYRFHVDNEWLGRLGESTARRVHLIEATAPLQDHLIQQSRPWLWDLLNLGQPKITLLRHNSPWPLVVRMVHPGSGMMRIATDAKTSMVSQRELGLLEGRFGRIPW